MTNTRFWLYYSLIMAVGFYPVTTRAAYIVLSDQQVCPVGPARQDGSCYGDQIGSTPVYLYRVTGQGVALDVFNQSCPQNSASNSAVSVLASPTYFCQSCRSGYDLVSLEMLIGANHMGGRADTDNVQGLTAGVDFEWGTTGTLGEEIYNYCHTQGETCYFHTGEWGGSDPMVCVRCSVETETSDWETYIVANNSVRRKTTETHACSESATVTYEYGCAANTAYVSGSDQNIKCRRCTEGETCNQQDGHTDGVLSCHAGYYWDDSRDLCLMCNDGYYQPKDPNREGISSCIRCPQHVDKDLNGDDVWGTTNHMEDGASVWKTNCYVCDTGEDCDYVDDNGTYHYADACYWQGLEYVGS